MKFYGRYQLDTRDCGVACLATIADYYGFKLPLKEIRDLEKLDMNGSSIYGICNAAEKMGFIAEAYQTDIEELVETMVKGSKGSYPFIAHIVKEDLYHFIVVKRINSKHIWIFDPAEGNIKLSLKEFNNMWTGYFISFRLTDKFQKRNLIKDMYKYYFMVLCTYKKEIIKILATSFFIIVITIGSALVFQHIIDHFIVHSAIEVLNEMNFVFSILIVVFLLNFLIYIFRGLTVASLGTKLKGDFIYQFQTDLIRVPITFYDSRKNGEVLERLNDIDGIEATMTVTFINIVLDFFLASLSAVIILIKSRKLFMITFVMMLMYVIEVLCLKKYFYKINRDISENKGTLLALFKEIIDGVKTIKSFAIEDYIETENNKKVNKLINSNYKNKKILSINKGISNLLESIGTVVLFWYGCYLVLSNEISMGDLLAISILAQNMLIPVRSLTETQDQIQRFIVSVTRLNDIINPYDKTFSNKNEVKNRDIDTNTEITINNLSFAYGYHEKVLDNINIKIKKGEKVAFVGKNGSGKTTLINLILKLRETEIGEIFIGKNNINDLDSTILHQKIAYVSQDTFLFSKTILDNLLLGKENISEDKINQVIHDCQLEELINKKEEGIHTIISENANNLSAGEKQRIGLARALLCEPEIIIFDEVTSNLDVISEKKIIDMIYRNCKSITCIFVAHRLQTIDKCDRIYVFDEGKIIESGEPKKLKNQEGIYSQMINSN